MTTGDIREDRGPTTAEVGRRRIFWLSTLLVSIVGVAFAFGAVVMIRNGAQFRDVGWTFESDSRGGVRVVTVRPGGPADGFLTPGERITAVDGITHFESRGLEAYFERLPAGASYRLLVDVSGITESRSLSVGTRVSVVDAGGAVVQFVVGLSFLIGASLFGLARREVHRLRMGVFAFLVMALLYLGFALEPYSSSLGPAGIAVLFAAAMFRNRLPSVLAFHFFSEPFGDRSSARVPAGLLVGLYAIVAVLTVPTVIVNWMALRGGAEALGFFVAYETPVQLLRIASDAFGTAMMLAMMVTIVFAFTRALTREFRRRLRWMTTGIVAGCLPVLLVRTADLLASLGLIPGHSHLVDPTVQSYIVASFVLVPASISYAVLRNRLFDITIVVRQSLQYAFARGVIGSIVALPAILFVWRTWEDRNLTVAELLFRNSGFLVLAFIAIVALKFRSRLISVIDRRFFREAYDTEQILLGLIEAIRTAESIEDVSTMASERIEEALHPQSCYVVFRDRDSRNLQVTYSSGERSDDFKLSEESSILRILEGEHVAQTVDTLRDRLPEGDPDVLDEYGIELVVPVTGRGGRSVGVVLLGTKASEEPFSNRDRRLLESVAAQMAIVFENEQLRERVAVARRERAEVLGRVDAQGINLVRECPVCGRCFDVTESVCDADGAELAVTLPVERTIEGKYRLDRLIGRGGMGAVYRGTDVRLGREVAIKVLTGALFGDQAALRRFEREAQASARLSHVNIVTVFDYGSLGSDGAFLVMELVNGQTLRHELRRDVCLAPERLAYVMEGVCDAVAEAHKAGVIHRDLKPENILLTEADDPAKQIVKVLDFGIAKILSGGDDASPSITVPGSVMGTLGYMSPEQIEGRPVDARTDIFALGVIAIEALTGSRPFSGSTIAALAASMASERVVINIDEPRVSGLVEVLSRAVAYDPEDRYGTVTEFREALVPALRFSEGGPRTKAGSIVESEAPTVVAPPNMEEATGAMGSIAALDAVLPMESHVTAAISSEPAPESPSELLESSPAGDGREPDDQ